ncbi:hypothetical protein [Peribacillus frigoritolerans]|uniref:hypothetical protein n=1 Tax=Peribacillus frigoritolerans TaxID=450367 RepID=UPI002079648A|nr:hypothetical protein [Peribacillus frigoritolerans]USK75892.1 hypothetical protein LIT31_04805 [Peribacillus frigoritolerans]
MNGERILNAKLVISADINLTPVIKANIEREVGRSLSDFEAAEHFLYAYLNPKIFALNEHEVLGVWDGIGDFESRINNFSLETF